MALAVPQLADGAVLDVLEEGELVRLGLAHRSDQGRALLEEITRRYPPNLHDGHPAARVMRLRQSVLVPELARDRAVIAGVDAAGSALVEQLDLRSAMAVPLLAGDRVLGVMLFTATERHYDQSDLRFAEEFVQRVAVALENAHLHQRADDAIHARDEFIALAAHELHGPLLRCSSARSRLPPRSSSIPR